MKQLSEALPNTQDIASEMVHQSNTLPTHQHGSINQDGQLTTEQKSQVPQSLTVTQAKEMSSLIQSALPIRALTLISRKIENRDEYGEIYYTYESDVEETGDPDVSKFSGAQKQGCLDAMAPTSSKFNLFWVSRLGAHKKMTNGQSASSIVLEDIARALEGYYQGAVITAIEKLIYEDKSPWFPPTAVILDDVKKIQSWLDRVAALSQITKAAPVKEPPTTPYKDLPLEKQLETDAMLIKTLGATSQRQMEFISKMSAMPENFVPTGVVAEVWGVINPDNIASPESL